MFELPDLPDWLWWGLGIVAFLPIATVILNEIDLGLDRRAEHDLARPVRLLRTLCLPLLFVVLLLRMVAGLDGNQLIVRVVDTVFWIAVINVALLFFNLIFFGGESSAAWRQKTPKLFLDLLRLFLVAIGTAIVISRIWGVDLGGLLTALGVGSIVIGLALQDTLGSLFSGIALLSARHYREGDWLQVGSHEGVVVSMNWRSVSLRTRSGDIMVLPNTDLAKQHVRNISAFEGWHSFLLDVEVSYEHPPERVIALIAETANAVSGISTQIKCDGRVCGYNEKGILYQARIFMDDYGRAPAIKSDFYALFWYRAQRAGIALPGAHNRMYKLPQGSESHVGETVKQRAELLAESGALSRSATALESLVTNARIQRFGKSECLVAKGRAAPAIFVVLEGHARVTLDQVSVEKSIEFHEFGPGEIILSKSVFRDNPARFDVRSISDVLTLAIPVDEFSAYLAGQPDLAQEIESLMTQRESAATQIVAEQSSDVSAAVTTDDRMQLIENVFRT